MSVGADAGGDGSKARVVPFVAWLAVAMALAAGVLVLARWLSGDLLTEPGMLGKLVHLVAGREAPEIERIELASVLAATAVGGLLGWGVAAAARRWFSRPRLVFTAVAVIGFIAWGVMAFTHAETMIAALWLNAMHIAAAVPIIGGLARRLPVARDRPADLLGEE